MPTSRDFTHFRIDVGLNVTSKVSDPNCGGATNKLVPMNEAASVTAT
jgi:hypothetical protein